MIHKRFKLIFTVGLFFLLNKIQSQSNFTNFVQPLNQPLIINNVSYNNGSNVLYYSPPIVLQDVSITNSANYGFISSELINIKPNSNANPNAQGLFFAKIKDAPFDVVLTNRQNPYVPFDPNPLEIGKYKLVEFGLNLKPNIRNLIDNFLDFNTNNDNGSLNPYDNDAVNVVADFYNNGITTRYGFYYKEHLNVNGTPINTLYPFRIRFSPANLGVMYVKIRVYINGQQLKDGDNIPYEYNSPVFTVVPSLEKGPLQVLDNKRLKYKETGKAFFAVGQNMVFGAGEYPTINDYIGGFSDFNDGANFTRIRMDADAFGIEWEELGVYGSERPDRLNNQNNHNWRRQTEAYRLDKAIASAEYKELYFMLCLEQDGYLNNNPFGNPTNDPNNYYHWNQHPYKTIAGVNTVGAFMQFTEPFYYWKRRLHYVIARWGYSPYLAMYEVFNETDGIASNLPGDRYKDSYNFRGWTHQFINKTRNFILTYDNSRFITTGFASCDKLIQANSVLHSNTKLNQLDCYTCNNYQTNNRYTHWVRKESTENVNGEYGKPFIFGENGILDCNPAIDRFTDVEYHNTIWSTAMTDALGAGLGWYDQSSYTKKQHLKGVKYFMRNIPFETNNFDSYYDDTRLFTINNTQSFENNPPSYQWFYSVNQSGSKSYGWLHNYNNWYATDPNYSLNYSIINYCVFPKPTPITIGTSVSNPNFRINKLQWFHSYQIDIFHTYNSSAPFRQSHIFFNSFFGLNVHNTGLVLESSPQGLENNNFQPDYAFRIRKVGQSFNYRTTNDLLNEMDFTDGENDADSLIHNENLNLLNDTLYTSENPIKINGVIDIYHNNYTFNWDFGNGQTSNSNQPTVLYNSQGNYNLVLTYTNTNNQVYQVKQTVVVLKENKSIIKNRNSLLNVYPNPTTSDIFLENKNDLKIESIEIYNTLSQLIERVEVFSGFITSLKNYTNGLYMIKIKLKNSDEIICFKVNKI